MLTGTIRGRACRMPAWKLPRKSLAIGAVRRCAQAAVLSRTINV